MASTIWKGHLTFGLVSIPVKLYRAARAEKVSFRQLHAGSGARVRQALVAESPDTVDEEESGEAEENIQPPANKQRFGGQASFATQQGQTAATQISERRLSPSLVPQRTSPGLATSDLPESREVSRSEIVKGFEYARNQYVTLTKEELAALTPETAREAQILEFVQLSEVDPVYFETSYYLVPDKGGERAYSLLFGALKQSALVGVAQVAMHNPEHVVLIRPGRHGLILHTMFYQNEIRQTDEYTADTSQVSAKEMELAQLLIHNLQAPFEPGKYHDTYKEKLDALIEAKISGHQTLEAPKSNQAPVVNILEALQRSLDNSRGERKPPATEEKAPAGPKPGEQATSDGRRATGDL